MGKNFLALNIPICNVIGFHDINGMPNELHVVLHSLLKYIPFDNCK